MKLYELSESYANLIEIEDAELFDTLEAIEEAIDAKSESIIKLVRALELQAEVIHNERERLHERMLKLEKKAEYLKNYVYENMIKINKKEIKSDLFSIKILNNPASVEIINDQLIPDLYKQSKTIVSVDKRKILESLKAGNKIEGAVIAVKTRLSIK